MNRRRRFSGILQFRPGCDGRRLLLAALLFSYLAGLSACAKIAEPEPPRLQIPKPATDLSGRQSGGTVLLEVSVPVENTDGSPVVSLREIEVFRVIRGPGESAPLPEDVFLDRAERILVIEAGDLDPLVENRRLVVPDPAATDFSLGYLYAVRFINRKNQTAGLGNQAFIAPIAIPPAPEGLAATPSRDGVRLIWKPPQQNADGSFPARVSGYNVFRSDNPKDIPEAPLNAEPLPGPEYFDRAVETDRTYYYAVSVVGSRENPHAESSISAPLAVSTADVFPPDEPKNLIGVPDAGVVTLFWEPPDDPDVAGYRVYRREAGSSDRGLLQPLVKTLSFRDQGVQPGKKYEYGVAAVDTHGNEGKATAILVEVL